MGKMTLLVLFVASVAGHQDKKDVENPRFREWSGFKPGSWVTFEQPWGKDGQRQETDKLVEITPEKAVFESTIVENGFKYPVFQKVISSTLKAIQGPEYAVACNPGGGEMEFQGPGGKMKSLWRKCDQGDEVIEVAGKKLKCPWIKMEYEEKSAIQVLNDHRWTKTWTSAEIPGGVAQLEMTRLISGNPPETLVVTRVLKGWKKE